MNSADVSVIIPCFNAKGTIWRSIDSVVHQTSRVREIIVVDDGSEPPLEIEAGREAAVRSAGIMFRLIHLPENRGPSYARNLGVAAAKGHWIAFLDADDIWLPRKVELQTAAMEAGDLLLSGHKYTSVFGSHAPPVTTPPVWRLVRRHHFMWGNPFFTPTVMARRDRFLPFDPRFRRVDDYKAWLENFVPGRCAILEATLAAGFKPPIGHSGLSGSIDLMHASFVEVLSALHAEGVISRGFQLSALLVESLKLPLRRYRSARALLDR